MLGGFDPRLGELFLERRRQRALLLAVAITVGMTALSWVLAPPPHEDTIGVELQAEINDFAVEEDEPEPEPEPEIDPPPPNADVKVVQKPKPKPKPKPPVKKVEGPVQESTTNKPIEVGPGGGGTGGGDAAPRPKPAPRKPEAEKPVPKPKPKPKAEATIDPTKPIDRPEKASAPKPAADNAIPSYPAELRDKGITGSVLVKLHVHRDGTVRGAKVLRKKNNATTEEDRKRADSLFLKAVIAAVKTWKYSPALLNGEPITVWHKVDVPFSLTTSD